MTDNPSDPDPDRLPDALLNAIAQAKHIAVLTGAGVSAESGIPTFRDAQTGLWSKFDPLELASPEGFARNPARVWEWYQWRRKLGDDAEPNAGHQALAAMESRFDSFTVITQNVDGFHQLAGSTRVLELHGNIRRNICSRTRRVIDADWIRDHAGQSPVPSPHHPEGFARPDVVWFGESLDPETLDAAFRAAEECDLMIVAGTAGEVQPAASLPFTAREAGAKVVDINPEATAISRMADWHLAGTSAAWLPVIAGVIEIGSEE